MPSKKEKLVYKIIMLVCALAAFGIGAYLAITMFMDKNNYFTLHFGLPICLACVAVIAFLMPIATKSKYGGDQNKDNLMMIVSVLLFLMAILTCVFSFFNLGF